MKSEEDIQLPYKPSLLLSELHDRVNNFQNQKIEKRVAPISQFKSNATGRPINVTKESSRRG